MEQSSFFCCLPGANWQPHITSTLASFHNLISCNGKMLAQVPIKCPVPLPSRQATSGGGTRNVSSTYNLIMVIIFDVTNPNTQDFVFNGICLLLFLYCIVHFFGASAEEYFLNMNSQVFLKTCRLYISLWIISTLPVWSHQFFIPRTNVLVLPAGYLGALGSWRFGFKVISCVQVARLFILHLFFFFFCSATCNKLNCVLY